MSVICNDKMTRQEFFDKNLLWFSRVDLQTIWENRKKSEVKK